MPANATTRARENASRVSARRMASWWMRSARPRSSASADSAPLEHCRRLARAPERRAIHRLRARHHRHLVRLATDRDAPYLGLPSTHVIAEESGHYIHEDDPDLVLAAIRELVVRN